MFIAQEIILISRGPLSVYCKLHKVRHAVPSASSFCRFFIWRLSPSERFVAMKYSLRYKSIVTKSRLTLAVAFSWVCLTINCVTWIFSNKRPIPNLLFIIPNFLVIVFRHMRLYFLCCRHIIQFKSEQVSSEAKTKFMKERKLGKQPLLSLVASLFSWISKFLGISSFSKSSFFAQKNYR